MKQETCIFEHRSDVSPTNKQRDSYYNDGFTPDLHQDSNFPQGARATRRGFTLIGLLVVVLIIGILAAVALPQYQKAVYKSRLVQLVSNLYAIKQAEQVYFLANGQYTDDLDKLDISISSSNLQNCYLESVESNPAVTCWLNIRQNKRIAALSYFFQTQKHYCYAYKSDGFRAASWCVALSSHTSYVESCNNKDCHVYIY